MNTLVSLLCLQLVLAAANLSVRKYCKEYLAKLNPILLATFFLIAIFSKFFIAQKAIWTLHFFSFDQLSIALTLQFDDLTWVMLMLVSFITWIICSYAERYLITDNNQGRFIAQLMFLSLAVTLLIMSGSLLTAFLAWQYIGLTLYLLLNHYHYDLKANKAAKKKFMINRVGDICFLIAVLLTFHLYGSSDFNAILSSSTPIHFSILILIFVAILTKTAQFPFHIWLLDTMETPTPVSAMMHAGVINAGGFLLARLSPWYNHSDSILFIIALFGLTTAILGQQFMRYQVDTKKRLAYSTMSQMGFMIVQCGFGAFISAVFHLITHGFYKATLFLNSGDILIKQNLQSNAYDKTKIFSATGIIVTVLIIIGYFMQNKNFNLPIIIWVFIALSLFDLIKNCLIYFENKAKLVLSLLLICFIYFSYLFLLKNFYLELSSAISDGDVFSSYLTVAIVILLVAAYVLYAKTQYINTAKLLETWNRFCFSKLNIEQNFRMYLINPTRYVGDIIRLSYEKQPHIFKMILRYVLPWLAIILCYLNFSPDYAKITNQWLTPVLTLLLITLSLAANRVIQLKKLSHIILYILLCISLISFSIGQRADILIGIYHLFNTAIIYFGLHRLLSKATLTEKANGIRYNRMPLSHVYLCILLMCLIGIPGTSTFITELYIFNALLVAHFFSMLLFAVAMLLISLFILHTLQMNFFNPSQLGMHVANLTRKDHFLIVGIIAINIVLGFYPNILISTLDKMIW